jgi:DNA-binding response OmpR family regulator
MLRVLIIEDDPLIAKIYRSRLENEGFVVEVAEDGQTGFARFQAAAPDAVLLDVMLPQMDGFQILRGIRAQPQFAKTPVFVVTNVYLPEVIHEATQAGATQIFHKARLTVKQIIEALKGAFAHAADAKPPADPADLILAEAVTPAGVADTAPVAPTITPAGAPSETSANLPKAHSAPVETGNDLAVDTAGDAEFQKELQHVFLKAVPDNLATLRLRFQDFLDGDTEAARLASLAELGRKTRSIASSATAAGLADIAQLSSALQALLKELQEKPQSLNPCSARTVAQAVKVLEVLLERAPGPSLLEGSPHTVLVVDDEAISARAIAYALAKVQLRSECLADPVVATVAVTQRPFDLIVIDQEMPGMAGFSLCAKLSNSPVNQRTPILLVTPLADLESAGLPEMKGDEDRIAKPFHFIEMTVKALTLVIKARLDGSEPLLSRPATPEVEPTPTSLTKT